MADYKGVNVAENWTAVQDQLRAEVRDWRSQTGLPQETRDWIEGVARGVREIVNEDFADIEWDTVRRLLVRGAGLLGQVQVNVDPDCHRGLTMAQTVFAVALFGQPGDDA